MARVTRPWFAAEMGGIVHMGENLYFCPRAAD
jgi:hypothetical protein